MANIISYKDAGISVFSNTIRALLTYFALSSDGTVIFSKKLLFYLLKMEEPEMIKTRHSHLMKKIEVALQELMDHKEIDVVTKFKDGYIVTSNSIWVDGNEDYFAKMDLEDMQKIFANCIRPFQLFDFYGKLLLSIGFDTKAYHLSQEQMAERWNLNRATVRNYINTLEDLNLICVYRCQCRCRTVSRSWDIFMEDMKIRDEIEKTAEEYMRTIKAVPIREDFRRKHQSVKKRYKAFVGGAKKYREDPELILELYRNANHIMTFIISIKIKSRNWQRNTDIPHWTYPRLIRIWILSGFNLLQ
ncbi:MAG: hypothetical protein ACLUUO_05650 [Sellimonas intestinalis]